MSIAWCHRLNGAPLKNERVFDYCRVKTHAYYVEQAYPAIPMIEQLIQCALNYGKVPTFTLIAHNAIGYNHFHLFKVTHSLKRPQIMKLHITRHETRALRLVMLKLHSWITLLGLWY